jgi:hypothetical protein
MGFPAEPEKVHMLLNSNPPFARVCGFIPKKPGDVYSFNHVPSLRKIEQFDPDSSKSFDRLLTN